MNAICGLVMRPSPCAKNYLILSWVRYSDWCGAVPDLKLVVSCQRRSKLSETFDMVKSTGFCTICLLQPISLSILDQSKSVARKALAHLPTATITIFSNLWLPRSGRRFPVAVVSLYSCRTRGGYVFHVLPPWCCSESLWWVGLFDPP
jgi:hypothetical protein